MGPGCTNCPVLKTSLFRDLSPDFLQSSGCPFRPARYRRNQILFFEGGSAAHLFALHSGLVKVVKSLENGKDRITRVLFPGELFGLESLTDVAYPLTAVALRDCEICAAPREDFSAYLRANPDIALGMVRFLVGELERTRTQVTDMSFKDSRMKVATFLLSLIPSDVPVTEGTVNLTLPLSRQEISEVLELSPETISRTLSSFRREELVTARGRHMVVQNRAGLEAVAHR
ncbi:MAG TPA: Crp/Fnr family transcriptional regulator [Terriglobia bacterium]|nr:Crp/Fnr family transcriptional regulator [Terriglobia bacterium]